VIRTALIVAALSTVPAASPVTHAAAPIAIQVAAADVGPFLGDWVLALQGGNGPGTFNLSLKMDADKVVGEIGNEAVPTQKISSITKSAKSLVLSYSFPYEAMTVDAVVSLTPDAEGKVAAQIDFAGGAYTMTGTATKKEKAK
jgi:hypothetical protein